MIQMKMYVPKILHYITLLKTHKLAKHLKDNYTKCSTFVIKAHIVLAEPLLECDGHRRYRYDLLPSAPGA